MEINNSPSTRRDPLAISFEAHRRLLLLRLRWHSSSSRRSPGGRLRLRRQLPEE